MPEVDELDRIWRAGLSYTAASMPTIADPMTRVTRRIQHKQRARNGRIAVSAAALVALVVTVAALAFRGTDDPQFSTSAAATRVDVVAGPLLRIHFPDQVASDRPPHVTLPRGRIRFSVRSVDGSHHLVIDGVPGFVAALDGSNTVVVTVNLRPGRYLMHCTIPGHTSAGEEAILIVR